MNAKFCSTTMALAVALIGTMLPAASAADPSIHRVKGHALWSFIDQISINAWEDAEGVHGKVVWSSNYHKAAPQDLWIFQVHTLIVSGNSAIVGGTIVFDNKTDFEGTDYYFL